MRPSADTGLRFIQFMTARVKLIFCRVIIIRGPHITHKTDLIDMLRQMWPPVSDFDATFAALLPANLHGKDCRVHITDVDLFGRH